MTTLPPYRQGSLPGEVPAYHIHIPKSIWYLLHQDRDFKEHWHKREPLSKRRYHLTVSCLTRGLTDRQMLTVLWIWHEKHGLTFDEEEFWKFVYPLAADYTYPFIMKHEANEYWKEIRRIASDPNARQHSKLRVAYYLMNTDQATAREIHEATNIPIKTVRNCLAALQETGKVEMVSFGVYRAVKSFLWDRATVVNAPEGTFVWDDEHPAMYWWEQTINEAELGDDGAWRMHCHDYCRDEIVAVLFDGNQRFVGADPAEVEWVVNRDGDVIENGSGFKFVSRLPEFTSFDIVGHKNGDSLDFRSSNLVVVGRGSRPADQDEDVDYYALLCA